MAIRSMMGVTWSPRESGCSSLSHSVALNLPSQPQGVGLGTSDGPSPKAHPLRTPAFTLAFCLAWVPSSLLSCPCLLPPGACDLLILWLELPQTLEPMVVCASLTRLDEGKAGLLA